MVRVDKCAGQNASMLGVEGWDGVGTSWSVMGEKGWTHGRVG